MYLLIVLTIFAVLISITMLKARNYSRSRSIAVPSRPRINWIEGPNGRQRMFSGEIVKQKPTRYWVKLDDTGETIRRRKALVMDSVWKIIRAAAAKKLNAPGAVAT